MKKILVFVVLVTAFLGCEKDCETCAACEKPPVDSCAVKLDSGLLAYFPFNGNFNDESGNGNHATAKNGAAVTTDFLGRTGKAAGFDGYDDYLIVPGSNKLNSDTITVSFQIMSTDVSRYFAAISRINFETAQSCAWNVHLSEYKPYQLDTFWTFSVPTDTDPCSTVYTERDNSFYAITKGPIKANRWYNVIVSFAGGVQSIYVDGVLEASKTRTMTKLKKCDNADLIIGGWWKNDVMSLRGKMDEVRIYKRVLNKCEIAKLSSSWN